MVIIGSSVSVFIVGIVVGNAFVVASVAAYREMRTLTNWMIVSLASADLLVAVAVLPLSAYQVPRFRHSEFLAVADPGAVSRHPPFCLGALL